MRAAVAAARALPFPFTLTARAENFLHGVADLKDTIRRLEAFADAGADVLFAPGLTSLDAIATVVKAVSPKPVNAIMVSATRQPDRYGVADFGKYVTFGASPRASIHLIEGARALAFLRGRDYVLPDDVSDLAPDVLRHRLVLSYEALADGLTPDQLVHKIMKRIPPPEKPLETHVRIASQG